MVSILLVNNGGKAVSSVKEALSGSLQVELNEVRSISEGCEYSSQFKPEIICIPFEKGTDPDIRGIREWQQICKREGIFSGFLLVMMDRNHLSFLDISHDSFSIPLDLSNCDHLLVSSLRQVSARSRVERSLREDYDHHNRIISKMPLGCIEVESGVIINITPYFSVLTGYERSEMIGKTAQTMVCPDTDEQIQEICISLHQKQCLDTRIRSKNGDCIPCRITLDSTYSHNPGDGLWFIEDRREYVAIKSVLRETEYECREQLYLSETLVIRLLPDGTISFANPAAIRCFGFETDNFIGNNVNILFPPGYLQDVPNPADLFLEVSDESSSAIHIFEHCKKNGDLLWIAWTSRGLYTQDSTLSGIICIGTDMTEQSQTGEERMSTRVWRDRILQSTDVHPDVFDAILQACIEIGREGREGKAVGTSFLVGDAKDVLEKSRQLILNPFSGHPPEMRNVSLPGVREMLKEYALLDGAFVVGGDGILEAAGRYITLDTSSISLPKGMGTRHSSVAALTSVTSAIGFVVSESGGRVSIMKQGKIIKVIA